MSIRSAHLKTTGIATAVSRADELYRQRSRRGAVNESVALLAAMPDGTEAYEVQWRLGRALFFLAQQADSAGARCQLHAAAASAGERAVAINPGRVEGHFWLGVNLALRAEASGGIRGARALLEARSELRRAASISEGYHDAGPLRVLGRLEHKAPWFIGGSLKRSRWYLERALAIAPANTVTLMYAAELALDTREPNRARELLEQIIGLPIDDEWEFENRRDRSVAALLLEKMNPQEKRSERRE